MNRLIKRRTRLETRLFLNAVDVCLKRFTHRNRSYIVVLFVDFDPCLEVGVAFAEEIDDAAALLRLDEAEKRFPAVYRAWMEKLEALEGVPRFKRWTCSKYFLLEDSRGAQLNFKDHTAQIELMDEMSQQCGYLCDYIVKLLIKPLLCD